MNKLFALLLLLGVSLSAPGCGGSQEGQRVEVSPEETAAHDAEVEAAERAHMAEQANR